MNLRKNINCQLNFPRFQAFVMRVDLIFKQNIELTDAISTHMINIRNKIKKNNLFNIVLYNYNKIDEIYNKIVIFIKNMVTAVE